MTAVGGPREAERTARIRGRTLILIPDMRMVWAFNQHRRRLRIDGGGRCGDHHDHQQGYHHLDSGSVTEERVAPDHKARE